VALSARNASGAEIEIARLERGEFFGEKSLLSAAPSDATVTALEDPELPVLESDSVHALIVQSPYLSQQIGGVMEARRKALQMTRTGGNGSKQAPTFTNRQHCKMGISARGLDKCRSL
jgi:CRP-like cAMP-binding protein